MLREQSGQLWLASSMRIQPDGIRLAASCMGWLAMCMREPHLSHTIATPSLPSCNMLALSAVFGDPMSQVTCHMSISLDGFVAGPDQSADNPLGVDGRRLHDWHLNDPKHPVDEGFTQRLLGPRGAYIMGRNMFGPVRGGWGDSDWCGWWGPEPPYHAPVFVLTHHPHDPIAMEGGTTFYFVDAFETALAE